MAKNKQIRNMSAVGASQHLVEKETAEKFDSIHDLAHAKPHSTAEKAPNRVERAPVKQITNAPVTGRVSPQLSCTISPEDKELLNELALYACNRERKVLNTSTVIRALIRLGNKYKEELTF